MSKDVSDHVDPVVMVQSVETLRGLVQIQCSDGNWNYDPYMHGMANGLIVALALFEGGTPEYLEAPSEWLSRDNPDLG